MDNLELGQPCFILYDGEWLAVQYLADVYAGLKFAFLDGRRVRAPGGAGAEGARSSSAL